MSGMRAAGRGIHFSDMNASLVMTAWLPRVGWARTLVGVKRGVLRLVGAVALVAVLVLAAAVARVLAPPVAGGASAAPVAGAPRVGDCVVTDPFTFPAPNQEPSATFGPCSSPHAGEVVGVAIDRSTFPAMIMDQLSVPDPRGCSGAAALALGLAGVPDSVRPWTIREIAPVDVVGPDPRQRAAGQGWVACVAYTSESALVRPLSELFVAGTLPGAFGTCETDVVGSCGREHTDQTFADVDLTYAMPTAQLLTARCRAAIAALTRMPDVTAGGRLRVDADVRYYDAAGYPHAGYPTSGSQPATATCGLHLLGAGQLVSTLVGLGAAPLPLAN